VTGEPLIDAALQAVQQGKPEEARDALIAALREHPDRLDLVHALAVTVLRLGEPARAHQLVVEAEALAKQRSDERDLTLLPQLVLTRAATLEEMSDPAGAEMAYLEVLGNADDHPLALQGLGHLYLSWGRIDEGLAQLTAVIEAGTDSAEYIEATQALVDGIRSFVSSDVHPRMFLEAHRGSYCEFFDHHAAEMAQQGWIAEAAKMHKDDAGNVVPVIPEGARPYAAIRVDLVDPSTGQAGLIGDQPMVVALGGHEVLSRAPVVTDWPGEPFPLWVSSQCPWDQLPIIIRFESGDAIAQADPTIGDWYTAGFDGAFGSSTSGRFHYISDPSELGPSTVLYHVDCGRSEVSAVDDLLKRLGVLHSNHPIAAVLIGRGFVPRPS
jgi:tetratricopeptide (TPR) repeat protein